MKKILSLTTFLFLLNYSYTQNSKFEFAIEGNVGISDRIFMINDPDIGWMADVLSKIEKPKIGYDIGLLAEYKLSKSFGIQTGLNFVSWGYDSGKRHVRGPGPDPNLPDAIRNGSENLYIGIPMRLKYYVNLKQSRVFFSLGYSPMMNINNYTTTTLHYFHRRETTKVEDDHKHYRKFNFTGELAVGWQKNISEKLSIYIAPNFKIQTFGISTEANLNRRLFYYGVSFGVKVH